MTTTIEPNAPPWSRLVDALQAEIRRKDAAIEELRAENERLRETLRGIRDANWRTWDNATADEFVAWAQSRARHVLADHADAYMDAPVTASERTAVASKHQRPNAAGKAPAAPADGRP